MSRALGNELPAELAEDLNGRDVAARWSKIIPLVTVDDRGFPHFAVLTYGEIVAPSARELRLGLYPSSSTSRNIQARPNVSVLIVHGDTIYYVKGVARHTAREGMARFDVAIDEVLVDSEPGARITAGLQFEMSQGKDAWLAQAEKTLAALR
ncbi:MAG: hypothetical protein JO247_08210 [Chloroflexi bacterium]|nr:hypothetical protein [Chloroflexota bacterium]